MNTNIRSEVGRQIRFDVCAQSVIQSLHGVFILLHNTQRSVGLDIATLQRSTIGRSNELAASAAMVTCTNFSKGFALPIRYSSMASST